MIIKQKTGVRPVFFGAPLAGCHQNLFDYNMNISPTFSWL